jgi:hypothetical protein
MPVSSKGAIAAHWYSVMTCHKPVNASEAALGRAIGRHRTAAHLQPPVAQDISGLARTFILEVEENKHGYAQLLPD